MSVEVIQADALWTRTLGVGADCQIVDPPYAAKVHTKAVSGNNDRNQPIRERDLGFDRLSPELMARIALYASQVRRWTLVYTDVESSHLWREAMALAGVEYVRAVPWVRWTQPQMSGDRPPSGREEVLFFHRAGGVKRPIARGLRSLAVAEERVKPIRKHWNGPGNLCALEHKALRPSRRGDPGGKHPTEKPLDQLLDLVSWVSDPGETVIDPCGGSGTTALAAALLGRNAVVLEQDATWAESACARLLNAGLTVNTRIRGSDMIDGLCDRDSERVRRFVEKTCEEATRVPYPKKAFERRTWERAQRRLADVLRVVQTLEGA